MQPAFHPTPPSARGRVASLSLGEGGSYAPPPERGKPAGAEELLRFARIWGGPCTYIDRGPSLTAPLSIWLRLGQHLTIASQFHNVMGYPLANTNLGSARI